jgi:zinc/manganese transport system substrate-binding protein
MSKRVAFAAGIFLLVFTACKVAPASAPPGGRLRVVATFSVLGEFVARVAGDRADVRVLAPAGSDAHEYEPAPSDAARVADADVLFEVGLGFESWLDALYASSDSRAKRVVTTAGIALRQAQEHAADAHDDHGEHDPHVWQDVRNAIAMVRSIEAALIVADPAYAADYRTNATQYVAELEALDAEIVSAMQAIPADERRIVTSHDALGYFGARYGLVIVGNVIDSISTEAGEPSAQEIAALIDAIRAERVRAIFPESMSNPQLVERVAREAGVRVGAPLFTDALSEAGGPHASYAKAMRANLDAIAEAVK